jgi:ATP-binding cassette subfamily C protein LapB
VGAGRRPVHRHRFELVLRMVRAHLLDQAGKKTDLILSDLVRTHHRHEHESPPGHHRWFRPSIHDFQGLREFLTAVPDDIIDLPFVALMLVMIGLLAAGWY